MGERKALRTNLAPVLERTGVVLLPSVRSMSFDSSGVHRIAQLACLRLEHEEEARYGQQLSRVLEQIDRLDAFEAEARRLSPSASRAFREDIPVRFPYREDLLEAAPQRHRDFFVVPRVVSSPDG